MSIAVAVVAALPVLPIVIAVLTSFCTNDAPSASTVTPVDPGRSTVDCVRFACAKLTSLTLALLCVPRMSTVVVAPTAPPTAIACASMSRYLRPATAGSSVRPAFTSAMATRVRRLLTWRTGDPVTPDVPVPMTSSFVKPSTYAPFAVGVLAKSGGAPPVAGPRSIQCCGMGILLRRADREAVATVGCGRDRERIGERDEREPQTVRDGEAIRVDVQALVERAG